MDYLPIHVHDTKGSISDSILYIDDYIKKAKELGLSALALTNHGSLSTFLTFYEQCLDNSIKPVVGCEMYFANNRMAKDKNSKECYHLILLAKNYAGLQNLIQLHNDAHKNGFYYKPRTDWEMLEKYHDNLICTSACLGSPLGRAFLTGKSDELMNYAKRLKAIFGEDFYLEIQPGRFTDQINYNDELVSLAYSLGLQLVISNDIHYLRNDSYHAHNFHVLDSRKNGGQGFVYPDTIYYFMEREELKQSFVYTDNLTEAIVDKALDNTLVIADKCNLVMPEEHFTPVFDASADEDALLCQKCVNSKKWQTILSTKPVAEQNIYFKRLNHELEVIKTLGFSGYFLIVEDIIAYCDAHNIARGPGRGSAAGSLVSYLLNISIADPVKYKLLFERFLSVHRSGYPDIDIDLDNERKKEVYSYIVEKYGEDRCCFISTFNMRRARAAIKAACRLLNVDIKTSNIISKSIPYVVFDEMGEKKTEITIDAAIEQLPDFARLARQYPKIIDVARSIENYPCSMGVHPAGIIISPVDITTRYPLINAKDKDIMATSLDIKDVEKLSGIKIDLLSLASLSVIHKTMSDVGFTFDYENETLLKDKAAWDLIGSTNSAGLFQISSDTYKSRMGELHPRTIPELAAVLALVRGPCISNNMDKTYIDIINGRAKPEHLHEAYWSATKNTAGVLIYQEQILAICTNLGFDSEDGYKLLKAVSKKKMDKIKEYKEKFYARAGEKFVPENVIDAIWSRIESSGLYAFNASHATSYALLTFCSAFLKSHYPVNFMCNLLTNEYSKAGSDICLENILDECKALGVKFLPPDINKSRYEFSVENGCIRIGLCAIHGFGEAAARRISSFSNIEDFEWFANNVADRTVNKRIVLLLIAAGCFAGTDNKSAKELADHYIFDMRKEKQWDGTVKIGSDVVIDLSNTDYSLQNKLLRARYMAS